MKVEGISTPPQSSSGMFDSYSGDAPGQSSTHTHHAEFERDEFGTIVNDVTVVTTTSTNTVTTRKRYRVEDSAQ